MNPYQSPIPIEELRPWFSGVPLWAKRAAKLALTVCFVIIICGLLNILIIWIQGSFYSNRDFVRKTLGTEAVEIYDKFTDN